MKVWPSKKNELETFLDVRQITCLLVFILRLISEENFSADLFSIRNLEAVHSIGGPIYLHLFQKHHSEKDGGRKREGEWSWSQVSIVNFRETLAPKPIKTDLMKHSKILASNFLSFSLPLTFLNSISLQVFMSKSFRFKLKGNGETVLGRWTTYKVC